MRKAPLLSCVSRAFYLAILLVLLSPPSRSSAQSAALISKPPCARGAIYVGGSSRQEAYCVDRRYPKINKAQLWPERAASRNLLRQETRRTATERTRTIYLHKNVRRTSERGGFSAETALRRKHEIPKTETLINIRTLRRIGKPATTRQDRSPRARVTARTKHMKERATVLHSRLRDRTQ